MDARTRTQLLARGIDPATLPPDTLIGGKTLAQLEAVEKNRVRKKREPSKTEQAWARHLDWLKQRAIVVDYWYEPFVLTLDDADPQTGRPMTYRPDFLVVMSPRPRDLPGLDTRPWVVEVKGVHIWEDSQVKFRAARAKYGAAFHFSMVQWTERTWQTVLGDTWTE